MNGRKPSQKDSQSSERHEEFKFRVQVYTVLRRMGEFIYKELTTFTKGIINNDVLPNNNLFN